MSFYRHAARDENSVTFSGSDEYDIALKIKLYIESWPSHEAHAKKEQLLGL